LNNILICVLICSLPFDISPTKLDLKYIPVSNLEKPLEALRFIKIRNIATNKCLDDTGIARNGQYYQQWDCSPTNENQWFVIIHSPKDLKGYSLIMGKKSGLCISLQPHPGDNSGKRMILSQKDCELTDDFYWKTERIGNGRMFVAKNGLVMHNKCNFDFNGCKIIGGMRYIDLPPKQIWAADEPKEVCKIRLYDDDHGFWGWDKNNLDMYCTINPNESSCNGRHYGKDGLKLSYDLKNDLEKIQNMSTKCICKVTVDYKDYKNKLHTQHHRELDLLPGKTSGAFAHRRHTHVKFNCVRKFSPWSPPWMAALFRPL